MLAKNKLFENFYNENFKHKEISSLCNNVSKSLMQIFFSNSDITNAMYEKEIFKIVKQLIIKELNSYSQDEKFKATFALYFFQKNLINIFHSLSELLMKEIAHSNKQVIDFLNYYTLGTIVLNNKKYSLPLIKANKDTPAWNLTSMFTILKTYITAQEEIEVIEKDLNFLEEKKHSYYKEELNPHQYNRNIENQFIKLQERIEHNLKRITIVHDSLTILHNFEEISKANQELKLYEEERRKLREEKSQLTKKRIKQLEIYAYESLEKKIEAIQRDTKALYTIIEQNKVAYLSIREGLTKALISKKQPL